MSIFAWVQPVDRVWKVVTDSDEGTIKIYNEKDILISEQKNLEEDAIRLIEENFLNVVATRLTGGDTDVKQKVDGSEVAIANKKEEHNYMYA